MAFANNVSSLTKLTKNRPPNLLDGAFNLDKFQHFRPNSSIGSPTLINKLHYKSPQPNMKRTRSNSALVCDPPKIISASKLVNTSSRIDASRTSKKATNKEREPPGSISGVKKKYDGATKFPKKTIAESVNKLYSTGEWNEHKKLQDNNCSVDIGRANTKRPQSPFNSKGSMKPDSAKTKVGNENGTPLAKKLGLALHKSSGYAVSESDVLGPVENLPKTTKRTQVEPTPVVVISCELDVKRNKSPEPTSRNKPRGSEVQKNNTISLKKVQKGKVEVPSKLTSKVTSESISTGRSTPTPKTLTKNINLKVNDSVNQKNPKRDKENTVGPISGKIVPKATQKTPRASEPMSFRGSNQSSANKTPIHLREKKTINDQTLEMSNNENNTTSTSTWNELKPQTLNLSSLTSTPKDNHMFKPASTINARPPSTQSRRTSRMDISQNDRRLLDFEENHNIQPSKNSEFSFKMLYFKPIDDNKLDEFIRDVNESQTQGKRTEKATPKIREKDFEVKQPNKLNLTSTLPQSSFKQSMMDTSIRDESEDITHRSNKQLVKSFNTLKTMHSFKVKSYNDISDVFSLQGSQHKNKNGLSRDMTNQQNSKKSLQKMDGSMSHSSSLIASLISPEKSKSKDSNAKLESKTKTTYSKLDKLLQEMKGNTIETINTGHVEYGFTIPSEIEKELFTQNSRGTSSSGSTTCSVGKSYANTLIKIASNLP